VVRLGVDHVEVQADDAATTLHNGDAITWWDLQGELQGVPVNVAEPLGNGRWKLFPNAPLSACKDLRRDAVISRNRDRGWERQLERPSAERLIPVDLHLATTPQGLSLDIVDDEGHHARVEAAVSHAPARQPERAAEALREALGRLGGTLFTLRGLELSPAARGLFVPVSVLNALRREAVAALQAARDAGFRPLPRARPVDPPVPYPEDTLSYLANVYNREAAAFYAAHGVQLVAAAYESHEERGDVPLMITKHCVRWSLSLCPKQAKGVIGVQGTVRAEPMTLTHGQDRFTLVFDCKPCEMHVVGKLRPRVAREALQPAVPGVPVQFYRTRPTASAG
jgi:putative protease